MKFSFEKRNQSIQSMQNEELDLLIIGGGITGAGLALQAAASGLKTGLLEMQDFAEGTSSRSTKLVHGGLRYLKNFDVDVVSDTVTERAVIQTIAPHIPKADPMVLPVYDEDGATFDVFGLQIAMDLYDSLAGINNTGLANKVLTKEEILQILPHIKAEDLIGGGKYLDFNNNDSRLVIENIKKADSDGALIASRVKVTGFVVDDKQKVRGVKAHDQLSGEDFQVRAKVVINTSGPWSDTVRNLDKDEAESIYQMRPTKGIHLVVDEKRFSVAQPVYFDTGLGDGRMVFVLPRFKKTYFGTTDTDYTGDLHHPSVLQEDVDYLLKVVNGRFPQAKLTIDDIESSWAGLRPLISDNASSDYNGGNRGKLSNESFDELVKSVQAYLNDQASRSDVEKTLQKLEDSRSETNLDPSQVSRGSELIVDDNGLVTLAGGKITDYRKMAQGAMQKILAILEEDYGQVHRPINSKTYPVSGGDLDPENLDAELESLTKIGQRRGLTKADAAYLAELYGSNAPKVFDLLTHVEGIEGLSQRDALSLYYSMNYEMALTPVDFFLRRTNYMLFMRDELDSLIDPVTNAMSDFYGWSAEEKAAMQQELTKVLAESDLKHLKNK